MEAYTIPGYMVNNSAFFYNASIDEKGFPVLVTTYSQLFESLQLQFINILLVVSFAFLLLTLFVLEFNNKNAPKMMEVFDGNLTIRSFRGKVFLLRVIAMICFPLSLFFFLLMISVKYGFGW
jgi:hypothetical protein